MTVVSALLPHSRHFGGVGLEVTKILLTQARFFVDFYYVAGEWGGSRIRRGEAVEDAFGSFARAPVRGGEELEGV